MRLSSFTITASNASPLKRERACDVFSSASAEGAAARIDAQRPLAGDAGSLLDQYGPHFNSSSASDGGRGGDGRIDSRVRSRLNDFVSQRLCPPLARGLARVRGHDSHPSLGLRFWALGCCALLLVGCDRPNEKNCPDIRVMEYRVVDMFGLNPPVVRTVCVVSERKLRP